MWLTGFDVKCLATLYLDKPMQGHTLMQAIARVNRVGGGKHGLIADYNGMLKSLRKALSTFAQGDHGGFGKGDEEEQNTVRDELGGPGRIRPQPEGCAGVSGGPRFRCGHPDCRQGFRQATADPLCGEPAVRKR